MELRNIKTFVYAAETGSFTEAAQRQNYAQSTVTQQIRLLEEELGTELFIRMGRRVALSSAGRALLWHANRMIALEQETLAQFRGAAEPEGTFFIGVIETIATSHYMNSIGTFLQQYPHVRLQVNVSTAPRLRQELLRGSIDMAILLDRLSETPNIRLLYHAPSPIQFIAAPGNPFANRPVRLKELTKTAWILTERGTNYRKQLEDDLAARRLFLYDRLEIGTSKTIIDFVAAGLGISILPAVTVANAICDHRVVPLHVVDYEMNMELQILAVKDRWLPQPLMLLAEMVAAAFAEEG